MQRGFYRPKYRDRKTGQSRQSRIIWLRTDPVTGRKRSTGCTTEKGASAYLAERERLARNPAYAASHTATVGQWIDLVNALKRKRKAEGTADMYAVKLGHVARIFGVDSPMSTIGPDSVDRFVALREAEGAGSTTIGKELTAIRQLCKLAKRSGKWDGDVSTLNPPGFSVKYVPRKRHLRREHMPLLAKALTPAQLAAVKFTIATSCRFSELHRAQREDVHLDRLVVEIRGTKTELANRKVPIVSVFRSLLEEALPFMPFSWPRMSKDLPEACEKVGIGALTANDLRRTHSTWLIEAGVAHKLVSGNLGHADGRMVERVYDDADTDALRLLMEAQIEGIAKTSKSGPTGGTCSGGPVNGSGCDSAGSPSRGRTGTPFRAEDFKSVRRHCRKAEPRKSR